MYNREYVQSRWEKHKKAAGRNIKKAQGKQKRDFDRRHLSSKMSKWGIQYCWKINGDMIERVESFHVDS